MKPISIFTVAVSAAIALFAVQACSSYGEKVELRSVIGEKQGSVSFSWKFADERNDVSQTAYQIDVTGPDVIWTTGRVESGNSLYVPYEGPALSSCSEYSVRVSVWTACAGKADIKPITGTDSFLTGLKPDEWSAEWIGLADSASFDSIGRTILPARYLRKEFDAASKVKRATLYVCGLGSSICYINGKRVGDDVFGPLPTWYPKSEEYLVYDVTDLLRKGANAIGVELGGGRFSGMREGRLLYFGEPRLIAQLRLEYAGAKEETVLTDASWMVTDRGPITENNEFDGEKYDARLELGAWTETAYACNDNWHAADVMAAPGGELRQQNSPALKVQDELTPVKVYGTPDGRTIVDMGQNMVGWVKVDFKGRKDAPVTMRFAEVLEKTDSMQLYVTNLRSALVCDRYTPSADGEFSWEPRFVYHGFRFVEISGLDYVPEAAAITGKVVYDEMKTTGEFTSSNEVLNGIFHNAYWGIRSNYRGMPTDCPQRDERQGWLGDRATGCYGESFIFDNEYLYAKWLLDIEESMREDGCISVVSPRYWTIYNGDVTWPSAFFYGADMLRKQFGNSQAIKDRYPAMKKWVEFTESEMVDSIVVKDTYGDWCMPPETELPIHSQDPARITSAAVLSTTVFYDILRKMTDFAITAGHPEDAARYAADAVNIRNAFNKKYFKADVCGYDNNTVTANLLALRLGLVPDEYRDGLVRNIVDKTETVWGGHVSGGVLGIQHLMRGLTENGYVDLAYKIATARTYPSWGYMIDSGATTIWELWNGNTADPSMNSRNHVMLLGDLIIWFYEDLAGIKAASPGFKEIDMAPVFPDGLTHVKASYDSAYGEIASSWTLDGGHLAWDVTIPVNTTATLHVPAKYAVSVSGSGVHDVATVGGETLIHLGSGTYSLR